MSLPVHPKVADPRLIETLKISIVLGSAASYDVRPFPVEGEFAAVLVFECPTATGSAIMWGGAARARNPIWACPGSSVCYGSANSEVVIESRQDSFGNQRQRFDMPGPDNHEIAPVQSGDCGHVQPFGDGDH